MPVTKACCLSEIQALTGMPSRVAQSRARTNRRAISDDALERSGMANQTRFSVTSRTTYRVSWPFSGCRPSMLRMIPDEPR